MARMNREQLNIIKDKFEVDKLWSFSKASTYTQCKWLYYLKYILRLRGKSDSCYTFWGTVAHEIMQDYYDAVNDGKEPSHEEMSMRLEQNYLEYLALDNPELKFPEDSQRDNYIANLRHYFANTDIIPYKVINEKPILAQFESLEKYVFQGYIDSEYQDDEGYFVIQDYKTSSMSGFSGKSLIKKATQLIIYAYGVSQFGRTINGEHIKIQLEKIKLRFDMMKYVNVSYKLKNGNEKVSKAERRLWVSHIANPIRKDFEEVDKQIALLNKSIATKTKKMNAKVRTEEEKVVLAGEIEEAEKEIALLSENVYDILQINEFMDKAITENTLEHLPKFIQDKYTVTNCYIDVELTEELVNDVIETLLGDLDSITAKTEAENQEEAFERDRIQEYESFYCNNLCDLRDQCKYYKEYKEHSAMFTNKNETPSDEELLEMLGL